MSKLCTRLNENAMKLPPVGSVLTFLKEIFTEEQAKIGAEMPIGHHTLNRLVQHYNRDEAELKAILEAMADEGTMFVCKNENNEVEYALPPFAPGILELMYLKGEESEKAIRRNKLIGEFHKELAAMSEDLYKDIDNLNKQMGDPGLRTLAVEEELPGNAEIATWERISDIIAKEDSFAVGTCTCRQAAKLDGPSLSDQGCPLGILCFFWKKPPIISWTGISADA